MQPVRFQSHQIKVCCVSFHLRNGYILGSVCDRSEAPTAQALARIRCHFFILCSHLCPLWGFSKVQNYDLSPIVSTYIFGAVIMNKDPGSIYDSELRNSMGGRCQLFEWDPFFWNLPVILGTVWQMRLQQLGKHALGNRSNPVSRIAGAQLRGLGFQRLLLSFPALLYDLKVPRWDFQTGRQLRTSPLYDRLDAQGARWMEKHGFERPKYFVPPDKGKKAHAHFCSFFGPDNDKPCFHLFMCCVSF